MGWFLQGARPKKGKGPLDPYYRLAEAVGNAERRRHSTEKSTCTAPVETEAPPVWFQYYMDKACS